MLGHGTPYGLLNVNGNLGSGGYTIDFSMVDVLRGKRNIFIWCNADQFVKRHRLKGLYSGMFVSEVGESIICGVASDQVTVDTSNNLFAQTLGDLMSDETLDYGAIHENVKTSYGKLALENQVANYNNERWYHM
jgi:hypothetical protein